MPCKYCNYETCYEFVAVASAFLKYTFSILLFYISIRFYSPFNCCNKCVVYVTFDIVASSFSVGLVFIKSPQYKERKSSFPI